MIRGGRRGAEGPTVSPGERCPVPDHTWVIRAFADSSVCGAHLCWLWARSREQNRRAVCLVTGETDSKERNAQPGPAISDVSGRETRPCGDRDGGSLLRGQRNRSREDIWEKRVLGSRGQPMPRPSVGDLRGVLEGQQEGHWAGAECARTGPEVGVAMGSQAGQTWISFYVRREPVGAEGHRLTSGLLYGARTLGVKPREQGGSLLLRLSRPVQGALRLAQTALQQVPE